MIDTLFPLCGVCQGERTVCPDAVIPFEVWHMNDGRKLLHVDGVGKNQYWIELVPAAVSWLGEQMQRKVVL